MWLFLQKMLSRRRVSGIKKVFFLYFCAIIDVLQRSMLDSIMAIYIYKDFQILSSNFYADDLQKVNCHKNEFQKIKIYFCNHWHAAGFYSGSNNFVNVRFYRKKYSYGKNLYCVK